jgi:hypothetical protein
MALRVDRTRRRDSSAPLADVYGTGIAFSTFLSALGEAIERYCAVMYDAIDMPCVLREARLGDGRESFAYLSQQILLRLFCA